jgi:hypothetical protein
LPDGLVPAAAQNLAIAGDKQGHVYVLDQTQLGKISASSSDDIVQEASMPNLTSCTSRQGYSGSCFYSTPAYYNGTIYMGTTLGPLVAIPINNSATPLPVDGSGTIMPSFSTSVPVDSTVNGQNFNFIYPSPNAVISASSATTGGVIWVLDNSNCGFEHDCGLADGPAALFAYDPSLNNLYAGNTSAEYASGGAIKFNIPTVANGHVYVASCVLGSNGACEDNESNNPGNGGLLTVYGLTP